MSDRNYVVVAAKDGSSQRFKADVLRKMLVEIWNFSEAQAAGMCLGFGMDPRPRPQQRMKSCVCGGAMDDSRHKFPKGFTFAVSDKYSDFR